MKTHLVFQISAFAFIVFSLTGSGQQNDLVSGNLIQFNDNGAWCWYQDERAIIDQDSNLLVLGSDASRSGLGGPSRNGNIEGTIFNIGSGSVKRDIFRNTGCDDHNVPGFIIRPDGKYLAFYADHYDYYSRYRTYNGESWSAEESFDWYPVSENTYNACYSNLFYLTEEDRLYNFVRSFEKSPNFLHSTNGGETWEYGGLLTGLDQNIGYVNGYFKYSGNGIDRISFVATEYHPRDYNTSLYHGYLKAGQTFNSIGDLRDEDIFDQSAPSVAEFTQVFEANTIVRGATMTRCWNIDMQEFADSSIALLFKARADNSESDHRFFYARFDGSSWTSTYLCKAGNKLYSSEQDYTGLGAIDPDNPGVIYISTPFDPRDDADLGVHEIFRGESFDDGASWRWTAITKFSERDNLRPIIPGWNSKSTAILWMRGTYYTAQSFDMAIVGILDEPWRNKAKMKYIDVSRGNTTEVNGSDFTPTGPDPEEGATDSQWHERTGFGNNGSVFTSSESRGESAPRLITTLKLPVAGSFAIWLNFWANPSADWRIVGGLNEDNLQIYRQMACKQVEEGDHSEPILITSNDTLVLYQAYLGTAVSSEDSTIAVLIDDYPILTGTTATIHGNTTRTWLDGISYLSTDYISLAAQDLVLMDTINSLAKTALSSNSDWEISYDTDWIDTDETSGSGNDTVLFTAISANAGDSTRMAEIEFSAGEAGLKILNIYQLPASRFLSVSDEDLILSGANNPESVFSINSNTSWEAGSQQAWLYLDSCRGANSREMKIRGDINPFPYPREGAITVSGFGVETKVISISQEGNPWMETSISEIELVSRNSVSYYFYVYSNVDWTISSSEDWFSLSEVTGSWEGRVILSTGQNPSNLPREATITISSEGLPDILINVMQEGNGGLSASSLPPPKENIYPNPAHDRLTVEMSDLPAVITLLTLEGRIIRTFDVNTRYSNLDITGIIPGVYLLSIGDKTYKLQKY